MDSQDASFVRRLPARRSMRAVQLLATLVVVCSLLSFAPATPAAAQGALPGSFARSECPPGVAVEGFRVECGFLTVAESRSNGNGRTIRLAVAIVRSPNPNPARDAVIFLAGGPGQGSLGLAPFLVPSVAPLLANRDFVLIDQRGTGFSQPALSCDFSEPGARIVQTPHGIYTLGMSAQSDRPEIVQLLTDFLIACGQTYREQGINLRAYNTVENAADLEDLRVALGYSAWNIYGGSYGTRLGLVAMQYRPATIRSAVLDSLAPPQYNFQVEAFSSYSQSLNRLFDACASDAQCNRAFPNLQEKYTSLVSRLNANPPAIPLVNPATDEVIDYIPITGVDVSLIIFQLFYSTGAIPILPALISTTAEGNYGILSNLLSLLLLNQQGPQDGGLNIGMTVAVQCNEDVTYASAADFVRARDRNRLASPLAFGILNNEAFLEVCQAWGLGTPLPGRNLPVRSDRPALLIGGEFDPITPEQNLSLAGDSLTNDFSIVVPRGGHTPSATSPCLQSVIAAFVNNPQQQPDAGCLGREVLPFLVPPQ